MKKKYETIVIFGQSLSETAIKDELKKIEKILEPFKLQDYKVDQWGRKQIAYPVKKQSVGTFVCLTYATEQHDAPNTLSSYLRISDAVLKFQTHVTSNRVRKVKTNPKRKPSVMQVGDDEFADAAASDF
ncbi:MAG: 30S ribosomal protein S6 [Oligoflexia bacterium]|nr:30S ribosomal protein S6 [Oligoflexia bacterium]